MARVDEVVMQQLHEHLRQRETTRTYDVVLSCNVFVKFIVFLLSITQYAHAMPWFDGFIF